jgi:hypothetical protein
LRTKAQQGSTDLQALEEELVDALVLDVAAVEGGDEGVPVRVVGVELRPEVTAPVALELADHAHACEGHECHRAARNCSALNEVSPLQSRVFNRVYAGEASTGWTVTSITAVRIGVVAAPLSLVSRRAASSASVGGASVAADSLGRASTSSAGTAGKQREGRVS